VQDSAGIGLLPPTQLSTLSRTKNKTTSTSIIWLTGWRLSVRRCSGMSVWCTAGGRVQSAVCVCYRPDDVNKLSSVLERAVGALWGGPLAMHDWRLGSVLTMPHTTQWMVEGLGADHSALWPHASLAIIIYIYWRHVAAKLSLVNKIPFAAQTIPPIATHSPVAPLKLRHYGAIQMYYYYYYY